MAKKTKYTKRTILIAVILTALSFLLCFGPCVFYISTSLLAGTALVAEKAGLVLTIFISLVMSMICLFRKTAFKSSLWIICIGLWLCLDSIVGMIIITAFCQTIDELVISPLARHFRSKALIAKEIDKRCLLNQ